MPLRIWDCGLRIETRSPLEFPPLQRQLIVWAGVIAGGLVLALIAGVSATAEEPSPLSDAIVHVTPAATADDEDPSMEPIVRSDEEWRSLLTPEQYQVLRQKGTEQAFSGQFCSFKEPGRYRCAGCGLALYTSTKKFESGTGWPSFFAPIDERRLRYESDASHGMRRIEVLCARCGSHLGHVFDDGPSPTRKRHCINSLALTFEPLPDH